MSAESRWDSYVMGTPARIMVPRIVLAVVTVALTCFGLVMIYSASSVEALSEMGDASYYVVRQAECIAIGLVPAAFLLLVDYRSLCRGPWLWTICGGVMLLLVAVRLFGSDANGAVRWVQVGPVRLQPSEFAKVSVLLAAAGIGASFDANEGSLGGLLGRLAILVVAPVLLILVQPDKGTTGIIVVTLLAVLHETRFPRRDFWVGVGAIGALGIAVAVLGGYSLDRITTMFDPWLDPYDSGYQLTRGFMAFGSGGLFGEGLGMSRMKYSYLPEAHNDFIFAIIGEELGLLGTLATAGLFFAFAWAGYRIARNAPDETGRLLAYGATTLVMVQFFLNVFGVLGWFPLSGKPLPFISYGGSSIMSCLMIVACLFNVSRRSTLPETVHDRLRRAMTLAPEEDTGVGAARPRAAAGMRAGDAAGLGVEGAGEATPRSARAGVPLGGSYAARGFRVVEGGAAGRASGGVSGGTGSRTGGSAGGYERIDLGPSPSERLRPDSGPRRRS